MLSKDVDMNKNSNIYGVPEGYFSQLQSRLEAIPAQQSESSSNVVVPLWDKVKPYIALAACFIMILCVGNYAINKAMPPAQDTLSFEDICYADLIPVTNPYIIYDDSPYTYDVQEPVSEDDIVEYLISSGASLDYIAYLLNE